MHRSKTVLFLGILSVLAIVAGIGVGWYKLLEWDGKRAAAREIPTLGSSAFDEKLKEIGKDPNAFRYLGFMSIALPAATVETPKTVEYSAECHDGDATAHLDLFFNTEVQDSSPTVEPPIRKNLEKVHGVTYVSLWKYKIRIEISEHFFSCEGVEKNVLPVLEKHFGAKLKRVDLPVLHRPLKKFGMPCRASLSAIPSLLRVMRDDNFPERIIIRTNWRLASDTDLTLSGPLSMNLKQIRGVESAAVFPREIHVRRKSNRDRWECLVPKLMTALRRQYGGFTEEPAFRKPRKASPSTDELRCAILCALRS